MGRVYYSVERSQPVRPSKIPGRTTGKFIRHFSIRHNEWANDLVALYKRLGALLGQEDLKKNQEEVIYEALELGFKSLPRILEKELAAADVWQKRRPKRQAERGV
jgi:hypothetical protein